MWSVHDVSAANIERATHLVERLEQAGIKPLTILVVPEGDWPPEAIDRLRDWAAEGHLLAAHGWSHRALDRPDLWHRFHSAVLSRDAAEHLSRSRTEVASIVERSAAWFAAHGLPSPTFYVPPAWAVGRLPVRAYWKFGFDAVETLTGITATRTGKHRLLPLAGFEADTRFRQVSVRCLDWLNLCIARVSGRPIRIAVHPTDEDLLLRSDLDDWVARPWRQNVPASPGHGAREK